MTPSQPVHRPLWLGYLTASLGLYAVLGGLVTLLGWTLGVYRLIDWENNGISMKANAALAAAAAGAALFILSLRPSAKRIVRALGTLVAVGGGLTLLEHVIGWNLGIDTLLFDEALGARATAAPGRMGVPASTSFLILGTALIVLTRSVNSRRFSAALGMIAASIGMLSLTGYLYGAQQMFALPRLTGIAAQTASMIFALGIGIVACLPERQPMRTLLEPTAAGLLARRVLPIIILLPLTLGWVRVWIQEQGWVDTAFGTALRTVVEVGLLVGLLWWATAAVRSREKPLFENRELLRTTLASIGDGVITTDAQGRVTFLNAVAESLTGWKTDETAGQPLEKVFRIVNESTHQPVESPSLRVLKDGVIVGLANHTLLIAKDGTKRPIDDSAAPIRGKEGEVVGCVLIFRDVTERRRGEKALQRSEQDLRDFFDNATVGLHWVGPDGIILRVNQTELDLLGYQREEYVGHNIAEFHADADVINEILQCLSSGKTLHEYPAPLRCKDGSIKDVLINSNVLWEDGKFIHTRCFTRDVTERKQAEEARARLAAIVNSSDDAIISKTLEGEITSWNAGAERLLGYRAEEIIGRPITTLIPPNQQGEESEILGRLRRGERIEHFETVRLAKDGRRIEVSLGISPIRDGAGRILGASKIARDITQRKQAEEALRAAQAELQQRAQELETRVTERTAALREINEQLEAFVYSIAHDLRAPLRSMTGFSQLLMDDHADGLNDTAQMLLKRINASSAFMDKLLLDLLAFGRAGRTEVDLGPVEVRKAWEVALFQTSNQAEQTNAHIETAELLPVVRAHEATLGQCLANLLSNAMKFVAPGVQPHIRFWAEELKAPLKNHPHEPVASSPRPSPPSDGGEGGRRAGEEALVPEGRVKGSTIRLWVEDNGIGIPPEHQERAFRVFERLNGARYAGTGIGLSIVRKGIERMGGKLGLESEPGKGTRFWIELPKAD